MNRRGVTLAELMVGLVIASLVGGAMVRLIIGEMRGIENREAWHTSRSVARSGVNRLVSDLRMVEAEGGLESAVPGGKTFTVRVPYAFGIVCSTNGTTTTVSLAPTDSAMYAASGFSGFAWRNTAGVYTYVTTATLAGGTLSTCTNAGITTLTGGRVVDLGGSVPNTLPVGTMVFLYRRIRYQFKASALVSGRTGLWRTAVSASDSAELAAPFDNTARVRYYILSNPVPQDTTPTALSNTRGLQLQLDGMSEVTPRGSAAPKTTTAATSVFFQNRLD